MNKQKLGRAQKSFLEYVTRRGFFPHGGVWAGSRATPDRLATDLIKRGLLVEKHDGCYPAKVETAPPEHPSGDDIPYLKNTNQPAAERVGGIRIN